MRIGMSVVMMAREVEVRGGAGSKFSVSASCDDLELGDEGDGIMY